MSVALARELQEPGRHVVPLYVELENNEQKTKAEKACAANLWREMTAAVEKSGRPRAETGHLDTGNRMLMSFGISHNVGALLTQAPLWVAMGAMNLAMAGAGRESRLVTGWIQEDCSTARIHLLRTMLATTWAAATDLAAEDAPELHAPLAGMQKRQVLEEAERFEREFGVRLGKYAWTCENPVEVADARGAGLIPCGRCHCCLGARRAHAMENSDTQPHFNQGADEARRDAQADALDKLPAPAAAQPTHQHTEGNPT